MSDSSPTLRPQPDEETIAFAGRVFQLARSGGAEQMRSLLAQGLPPNLRNDKGDTLLMLAAYHLQTDTVRALLEGGADPEIANDRGQTPLGAACFKGGEEIVRLLLEHGACVDEHRSDCGQCGGREVRLVPGCVGGGVAAVHRRHGVDLARSGNQRRSARRLSGRQGFV